MGTQAAWSERVPPFAPILRADQDADRRGQDGHDTTEINRVEIQAPVDGVLVISGTAYVNNLSPVAIDYILNAKLDGSNVTPARWVAFHYSSPGDTEGRGRPARR